MGSELIIIKECCSHYKIEYDFIIQLEKEGLIEILEDKSEHYIHISQLKRLEQYIDWYYGLSINISGIDVIQNLLDKMEEMQEEMQKLRQQVKLLEKD